MTGVKADVMKQPEEKFSKSRRLYPTSWSKNSNAKLIRFFAVAAFQNAVHPA